MGDFMRLYYKDGTAIDVVHSIDAKEMIDTGEYFPEDPTKTPKKTVKKAVEKITKKRATRKKASAAADEAAGETLEQ
jgi:hypothetical protein